MVEPLLEAAGVVSGLRVLDLAAGPGYVTARAAARGAAPLGIDVAAAMVELARQSNPGLEFRQASATQLPLEDETFDAVVGNFMILHVGDPERVAAESERVLKRGGTLALSTWDLPDRARLFGVMLDAIAAAGAAPPADVPTGPSFFRFSQDEEFERLLGEGGFTEVRVETLEFFQAFLSVETVWKGMVEATVRTAALVVSQTRETRARIRAAFDERMSEFETDTGLELPVSVKIASGRKPPA